MQDKVKISLTIPERAGFETILRQAADLGFTQEQALPRLGVATGTAPEEALEKLRAIEGIASVERQRSYRAG